MSKKLRDRTWLLSLILVLVGIFFLWISNAIPSGPRLGVDWSLIFSSIGTALFISALFQWAFELKVKKALIEEVVGYVNIVNSGLVAVYEDSKQIDYSDAIRKSDQLVIACHYSTRIFFSYSKALRERFERGKKAQVLLLNTLDISNRHVHKTLEDDQNSIANQKAIVKRLNEYADGDIRKFEVKRFSDPLKYSFVLSDDYLWVTLYKNTRKVGEVPAIKIRVGSELYAFFSRDIEQLISESLPDAA